MLLGGVTGVIDVGAASLAPAPASSGRACPEPAALLDHAAWLDAPYRPVPNIVEAACLLYARHGVAEIRAARADATNLRATTDAILAEIAAARAGR